MSHQPFETWILSPEELSSEDRRVLRDHLESCAQCQKLQQKWGMVGQALRARRMVAPAPGFAQRWQASLVERRAREQRRQALKLFGIFLGAAVFVLLVLAGYLVATSTPAEWLAAFTRTASSSANIFNLVVYVVRTWLSSTPLALNLALWIYLTITLCVLCLTWALVMWRTKHVGVLNQ